jgi:hypothetical protein
MRSTEGLQTTELSVRFDEFGVFIRGRSFIHGEPTRPSGDALTRVTLASDVIVILIEVNEVALLINIIIYV